MLCKAKHFRASDVNPSEPMQRVAHESIIGVSLVGVEPRRLVERVEHVEIARDLSRNADRDELTPK